MFDYFSIYSFANLHIGNVNFLQCKSSSLDIDMG